MFHCISPLIPYDPVCCAAICSSVQQNHPESFHIHKRGQQIRPLDMQYAIPKAICFSYSEVQSPVLKAKSDKIFQKGFEVRNPQEKTRSGIILSGVLLVLCKGYYIHGGVGLLHLWLNVITFKYGGYYIRGCYYIYGWYNCIESFLHDLERTKTKDDTQTNWHKPSKQGNAIFWTHLYLILITSINHPMKSRALWDWPIRSMWWREPCSFGWIDCQIVNFACCFRL